MRWLALLLAVSCHRHPIDFQRSTVDGRKRGTVAHDVKDAAEARAMVLAYCGSDYGLDAMNSPQADQQRMTFTFHCETPRAPFEGPRLLTLVGPTDDVEKLALELGYRGFSVKREVPGATRANTRYVAKIDGVCGARIASIDPTLAVDVYDGERSVFRVAAGSPSGCPDEFFVQAAVELAKAWPDVP